jgi:hypothetical protein
MPVDVLLPEEDIEQYVPPYREIENGKMKVNFHSGQQRAWDSKARFIAVLAGTQGGKTCFAPDWLYREINRTYDPKDQYNDYIVATATYPLLELKLLPEMLNFFEGLLKLGKYNSGKNMFQFYDTNTRLIFASATNPESIESATAKAAILDEVGQEQFRQGTWRAIRRRLSLATKKGGGRCLFLTTLYQLGWLKKEVYDKWLQGDANYDVVQFDSIENPAFPKKEYYEAKESMPRFQFDMQYRGRYTSPAGLIYDTFDPDIQVIKPIDLPKEWPRYFGIDFGQQNTAALWAAQDYSSGTVFIYREYLAGGCHVDEHVENFKRVSGDEPIIIRVGGSSTEEGWREAFGMQGWPIQKPYVKDVTLGINRAYAFFKTNKIRIFDECTGLVNELQDYSWMVDEDYNSIPNKIANKDRYHRLDAMRYLLSELEPLGAKELGKIEVWNSW